ncbi:Hypothetical predicted protein [Olea europaea subsp. europaea]|uniref:Uncharacterized protein n=1 Tax=Olea europaea subsp. europaea TaxID=158383 RepID=A0A8S0V2V3_OLEEU|nr:Hypothetical predicted protein [Olea europaea subsp. europaea]
MTMRDELIQGVSTNVDYSTLGFKNGLSLPPINIKFKKRYKYMRVGCEQGGLINGVVPDLGMLANSISITSIEVSLREYYWSKTSYWTPKTFVLTQPTAIPVSLLWKYLEYLLYINMNFRLFSRREIFGASVFSIGEEHQGNVNLYTHCYVALVSGRQEYLNIYGINKHRRQ